ncbi:MAG: hypothetical protein DMG61_07440 [Acidobacteria bacterium]|nr:MAG: hypothetical protein DMG61_07440 [Acidobacteriota bacterium]
MNLGFPEMMFIFILALILFGPKKLPEIGRQIGKGLAEFKRASREFQSQIEDEVRKLELEADLKNTIAPPISLSNTVASQPPALTVGSSVPTAEPGVSSAPTAEPTVASASSSEMAAAASQPDYTVTHSSSSHEAGSSKADSAGNA